MENSEHSEEPREREDCDTTVESNEKETSKITEDAKRSAFLGEKPIIGLLVRLSVPAIVGMLVMSLYNIVDGLFIGQGTGQLGLAGLTVAFPLEMWSMSLGLLIGIGGGTAISHALGAKKPDLAAQTLGNMYLMVLFVGIANPLIFMWLLDPILTFLGASAVTLPYARDYAQIIVCATFGYSLAMMCNNALRAEGAAIVAALAMIGSSLLNTAGDPILIFAAGLGLRGAASSTLIATTVSGLLVTLLFYFTRKSSVRLTLKSFIPRPRVMLGVLANGLAPSLSQFLQVVLMLVINRCILAFDPNPDITLAAYGVVNRLYSMLVMPLFGVLQGFLPIAGYNIGAKKLDRVRESIWKTLVGAGIISVVLLAIFIPLADYIVMAFGGEKPMQQQAALILRIISAGTTSIAFQGLTGFLYQALRKPIPALLITLLRQFILLIPLCILFANTMGSIGIWVAFPVADVTSAIVSVLCLIYTLTRGSLRKRKDASSDQELAEMGKSKAVTPPPLPPPDFTSPHAAEREAWCEPKSERSDRACTSSL